MQDVKNGKPRFYKYGPSLCNYGAIPQTWEDPTHMDTETGFGGDNDPIDVLQINAKACTVGEVQVVRVLGVLAMIDDGENAPHALIDGFVNDRAPRLLKQGCTACLP
jgi:inorganic pyrophosphatase